MIKYKNLTKNELYVGKIIFKCETPFDSKRGEKLIAQNLLTPDNISALLKAEIAGQIRFLSGDRSVLGNAPEVPALKRRILIKRNGGIGDILMTTPLLTALKQKDPNALIYYETIFPELLEGNSDLSVLIKGNKNRLYGKFDETIDLNRVVETLKCGGGILCEEVSANNNRIDLFFDYAKLPRVELPKTKYFIRDVEREYAEKLLESRGVTKDTTLIGYAGFAIAHRRAYPVELAKQLFDLLCENPKVKIVIFGRGIKTFVREDRNILDSLPSDRIINLSDKTNIRQLGAVMSKCKAIVTCDTGLLHLANAIGIPNVALFGTIKPWLRVKHYPQCKPIEAKMPCSPCNDRCDKCPKDSRIELNHTLGAECMWKITPEEIRDAVFDRLKQPVQKLHQFTEITQNSVTQNSVIQKSVTTKDVNEAVNNLCLPNNEWKAYFPISSIEANHYAGGHAHIWGVIHALLANNVNVVVVSQNQPLIDRDFTDYPNRDKLHIIIGDAASIKDAFCFDFVIGMQPCGSVAVELAKKFDVPSYLWLFDPLNYAERFKHIKEHVKLKWERYKEALKQADYIVISTEAIRKWTEKWTGCPKRKIVQLYPCINSIEADKVKKVRKKNEITFLGRITSDKHPEQLFDTVTKNTLINFVGPIDTESDLKNDFATKSQETGIKYNIYERITDKEKFEILKRSKLLVYPSHYEAFGLPPLEANYVGTPSVVYDLPPFAEWCGKKNGISTVKLGDSVAFKDKAVSLLAKPLKVVPRLNMGCFDRLCKDVGKFMPPFRPSVIMTVYNESEYIEYALKSIYDWAWEIIIVEGVVENMYKVTNSYLSTDNTSKIIEQFIKKHDKQGKIKYKKFYRTFENKIEAQNEAIKEITGNIIFKLDGDEVYKSVDLVKLKQAYISDPELDLVYFTTLNFWTSFKLVTKGANWCVGHFKIARYKKGMKYVDGHSQMRDKDGEAVDWHSKKYKTIFMPDVVNYHFGWTKKAGLIKKKLDFVKNRNFDHIDTGVNDTYSSWKHGEWTDPYVKKCGVVYPYLGTLPVILKNHPYYELQDVRK